jgi:tetratricopeptide (TPR) repeat protein
VTEPSYRGAAAATRSWAALLDGQHEVAERESVAAIDIFRAVGDICNLVWMLSTHSRRLQSFGRIDEAESAVREAEDVCEVFGLRGWQVTMRARLGSLALERGDHEAGAELYRTAVDLARELALSTAEAVGLDGLGLAHRRSDDFEEARRCHQAARAIADRLGRTATMVGTADEAGGLEYSTSQLGFVAEQVGDLAEARRWHGEALVLARRNGNHAGVALAVEGLAAVAAAGNEGELAATLLGAAEHLRATVGSQLHGNQRTDIERAERRARTELGDDGYVQAYEAGRAADLEAVLGSMGRRPS